MERSTWSVQKTDVSNSQTKEPEAAKIILREMEAPNLTSRCMLLPLTTAAAQLTG
jgi:hypothetical protein